MSQNRFDLGAEDQAVVILIIVHRLLADAISGQKHPRMCAGATMARALATVVDREGEHTAQPLHTIYAPLFIGAQNHFCVGARAKAMAACLELLAQLDEIINFPVKHDPAIFRFVGDGLLSTFEIDNTEPVHAEDRVVENHRAVVVGTAVSEGCIHRFENQGRRLNVGLAVKLYPPTDATHVCSLRRCLLLRQ